MTTGKPVRPSRCGFGRLCALRASGPPHNRQFTAEWDGQPALNRDGTLRVFTSESFARAWLAAADATNGASFRHQCT